MYTNKKIIDSNNVTLDKLNKKMELIQQTETNNNEKEFSKLSLEYVVLAEELVFPTYILGKFLQTIKL